MSGDGSTLMRQRCPACGSPVTDLLRHYREGHQPQWTSPISRELLALAATANSPSRSGDDPRSLGPSQYERTINAARPPDNDPPPNRSTAHPSQGAPTVSRSCRCGGSNENCMFCFGTGTIEGAPSFSSVPSYPMSAVSRGRRITASSGKVRATVPCPACGIAVVKLQKHLNRVHPDYQTKDRGASAELGLTAGSGAPSEKKQPDPTGHHIVQGSLAGSAKAPSNSKSTLRRPVPASKPKLQAAILPHTTCPHCGCPLKPHNVQSHVNTKCRKNPDTARIRAEEARRKQLQAKSRKPKNRRWQKRTEDPKEKAPKLWPIRRVFQGGLCNGR